MSQQAPIADLSYRNYDGPKSLKTARWWVIARNGLRVAVRKKGLWVMFGMSSLMYLFLLVSLFVRSMAPAGAEAFGEFMPTFRSQLLGVYEGGFWPLMIALLVGSGSIAADNRANALQVYLAKPLTKRDYLVGKWLSIFLIVFGVYFAPLFVVVLYQAFDTGIATFVQTEGVILASLPILAAVPATLHASILVGLSAWNRTPWIVGVIYAGLYFFSSIFSMVVSETVHTSSATGESTLAHLSIEGVISGIGQWLLSATPRGFVDNPIESRVAPSVYPLVLLMLALVLLGIAAARARIRAVEVVQG